MKKSYRIALVSCGIITGACSLNASLIISNPASVPAENIAMSQTNATRSYLIFNKSETEWQSVIQTFNWTSDESLDGLGLKFASNQAELFSGSQDYVLAIQKRSTVGPTSTEMAITFTLTESVVSANQWIYFDFDDVELENPGYYAFVIAPAEDAVSDNQISLAQQDIRDSGSVAFPGQSSVHSLVGAEMPPPTDGSFEYDFKNNQDLTFYMTIPSENNIRLIVMTSQ